MPTVRIARETPITRKEWRDCIEADPELRTDGEASAHWSKLAEHEFTLLVWRDGGIEARDPPPELLAKMERLAGALDAVIEDDMEIRRIANPKAKPPRQTHLDPLQWQIVAWLAAAAVVVIAGIVLVAIKHMTG